MRKPAATAVVLLAIALLPCSALATPITYSFSSGDFAASATFDQSGTSLIVTLTNTSTHDAMVPTDILTAVYFDVTGDPALSRTSAILAPGSVVKVGGTGALVPVSGGVVGGEWAYLNNTNPPLPNNSGVSSVGLGVFGPGDLFPGPNLEGPTSPDGVEFGITSLGDNLLTGNGGLSGEDLIQNSVVFTLGGYTGDPSTDVTAVTFQYGTAIDAPTYPGSPGGNPNVPEPATLVLMGTAAIGLLVYRARRLRSYRAR